MRVIGLTGPARAGKDTVAGLIRDLYPGKVIRQGFADKLKLSAARLARPDADLDWALRWCNSLKETGEVRLGGFPMSGRQFLQRYGTEAHREVFGEDFWLDAVLPTRQVNRTIEPTVVCTRDDCDLLVIPDVRFDNEAQRVLDCGGLVWKIVREDAEAVEAHASEAGVPDRLVSEVIPNDSTIEALGERVAYLLDAKVPA